MIANKIISQEFEDILKKKTFESNLEKTKFLESLNDDILSQPIYNLSSPEGRALDLVCKAKYLLDSDGMILAKEALTIDPNCVEAYNYLGEAEVDDNLAITYYKKGISIGRKLLGENFFKENRGLFFSIPETRSLMRCLVGYASILDYSKKPFQAIQLFEQILSLDIKDHLSVRHLLMLDLIKTNNVKKFLKYEQRFVDDDVIYQIFNRTLFYFKTTGESKITFDLLSEAMKKNKYVIPSLISISPIKRLPDLEEKELMWAVMYNMLAKDIWIETDGAINWLRKRSILIQ